MKFLFLMDKLKNVIRIKDTSYIFILEAYKRGNEVYYIANKNISLVNQHLSFFAQKIKPLTTGDKNPFELIDNPIVLSEQEVDCVFIRTEPPFDEQYLTNTWLLSLLNKKVFCFNDPRGIREVNEKIWLNKFSEFSPRTLITQDENSFKSFLEQEQKIIAKPLDGFGGKGVFIVSNKDSNSKVIFETLSENSTKKIILQEYVKDASKGDKRILLLNGEILDAVLRVNDSHDHRNNFFAGGHAKKCEITEFEKKVIEKLKPYLQELGLYFVGLDFLGDKLTEVNVTSPTCLQEMNTLYCKKLEVNVINFVERKIKQCQI